MLKLEDVYDNSMLVMLNIHNNGKTKMMFYSDLIKINDLCNLFPKCWRSHQLSWRLVYMIGWDDEPSNYHGWESWFRYKRIQREIREWDKEK